MSHADRQPPKVARLLRAKAQEFLSSRKHSDNLVDIVRHFATGADQTPCVLALEMIFVGVLKERGMVIEVVPLKPVERSAEVQYREWLRGVYEEVFGRIAGCCEAGCTKTQMQGGFGEDLAV